MKRLHMWEQGEREKFIAEAIAEAEKLYVQKRVLDQRNAYTNVTNARARQD